MRAFTHHSCWAVLCGIAACTYGEQQQASFNDALIARAAEFELPTVWEEPPGDPMEHEMAGFAKILCSAVFITGLEPAFAAEIVVVRLGHYKGSGPGARALRRALALLMEAAPN